MAYTTISGNLTTNTTWTAGTYLFTASCSLGSYNLILDTTGGNIYFKTKGAYSILINGAGTCTQTGTGRVDCTSSDDDSIGEIIDSSSGNPLVTDHTASWFICSGTSTTNLSLIRGSCRYTTAAATCIIGWSGSAASRTISLSNWEFYNNALGNSAAATFIGIGTTAQNNNGLVTINNIKIDSTNSIGGASTAGINLIRANGGVSVSNVSYTPTGVHLAALRIQPTLTASPTNTVYNFYAYCDCIDTASFGVLSFVSGSSGSHNIVNASFCVVTNTGAGDGIMCSCTSDALTVTLKNCVIKDCDGTSAFGLQIKGPVVTVTHTHNRFFGNKTHCSEALDITESIADPQFGNLPVEATIDTENCPFSDGLAVTNLTDYEKQGSGTFDDLVIDETQYSATGTQYLGTDLVTPGINYKLTFDSEPYIFTGSRPHAFGFGLPIGRLPIMGK